jgi:hypothetical protein
MNICWRSGSGACEHIFLLKAPCKKIFGNILLDTKLALTFFFFLWGFIYFVLFCFVLFYFVLFYFILFYFILFYFILFYFILFYFILFYFKSDSVSSMSIQLKLHYTK